MYFEQAKYLIGTETTSATAQKIKFSVKNYFINYDLTHRKLRTLSNIYDWTFFAEILEG